MDVTSVINDILANDFEHADLNCQILFEKPVKT